MNRHNCKRVDEWVIESIHSDMAIDSREEHVVEAVIRCNYIPCSKRFNANCILTIQNIL